MYLYLIFHIYKSKIKYQKKKTSGMDKMPTQKTATPLALGTDTQMHDSIVYLIYNLQKAN